MNTEAGTGYAGHNDWRVPNIKELMSLVNYSLSAPAIGSEFNNGSTTGVCNPSSAGAGDCSFTDPGSGQPVAPGGLTSEGLTSHYWSSTTEEDDASGAWDVGFASGRVDNNSKDLLEHVRLVRGGCSNGTPLGP